MSGADWAIVVVIGISVISAISEGFFHEAFGIAGLVVGYIAAAWYYPRVAEQLAPYVNSPRIGSIAGFLIIFFAVMIVASIIGRITRRMVREAGLSWLDHTLGGAVGLVRGSLMVAIVLVGMAAFAPAANWLQGSQLAPYFLVVGRAAVWAAPTELRAKFYEGLELLRHQQPTTAQEGNPQTGPAKDSSSAR